MNDSVTLHWRNLSAAPHRMFFFGGAVALVLSALWWGAILLGRMGIIPHLPVHGLLPTWMHAWLMVYGIFPFFVLGFLLTAFPRWVGAPPVPRTGYIPVSLALYLGYLLVLLGGPFSTPVAATGMALTAVGWVGGLATLVIRFVAHRPSGSPHPPWAIILLLAGLAGAWLSVVGAITNTPALLSAGPLLGVWGFLAPMVLVVGHRMIPFFAQAALPDYAAFRPAWVPTGGAVLFLVHTGLLLANLLDWLWLTDIPLAGLGIWLLWHWRPWATRSNPLLWSLFVAFLWLPVALGLSALQSLLLAFADTAVLGFAPLHVLTIGLLTSMVLAMATRVSMGHSGRGLRMDKLVVVCFVVLQWAVVIRLIAEIPHRPWGMYPWLIASVILWLLAWLPWAIKFGLIYWQARADGKPG